eukprot:CAMPEP_0197653664 /NCGR_PEP_ID=MMETSP1338-20131121/36617_1 /TAXON_ID=43686 ORGANISM="Pelagodinium beii, Strain RCC1491" /NCGR_SAMPLE_ID=MMETSP1338 /ASSEMBLY_ACC=CAM_ASM_000754 /LENGTH=358 /DNA_ID=CAMNT_0043228865 /DNA_START=82 /DNA_END=1155 /DNA_ORIENTATION=+
MAASSALVAKIEEALKLIDYPSKEKLWEHVQALGRKHSWKFPSFLFIPRGGLSSPYVQFITDADLIYSKSTKGGIQLKEFETLHKLVKQLCGRDQILSAKVSCRDKDLFDGEVVDFNEVRTCAAKLPDVVNITGSYKLESGWRVPIDFTLQEGEQRMPKEARVSRMVTNAKEGNFAKVVQRLRGIIRDKGAKAEFAKSWNATGGALRFLVKQLELVKIMDAAEKEAYMTLLHLPPEHSHEEWLKAADAEMQRRAVELLLSRKDLLSPKLGSVATTFFGDLEAAAAAFAQRVEEVAPAEERRGCKRLADVLSTGTDVKAKSSDGSWYKASVVKVRKSDSAQPVKVHYEGSGREEDEWVS